MSNSRKDRKFELYSVASTQHGYFTSIQAKEAGYAPRTFSHKTQIGQWEKIFKNVFRLPGFDNSHESECMKWALWSQNQKGAPQAVTSHESALFLWKLTENAPEKACMTVKPGFRKPDPEECVFYKSNYTDEEVSTEVAGANCPVTTPLRSLCDTRDTSESSKVIEEAIKKAINYGLISEADMRKNGLGETAQPSEPEVIETPSKDNHDRRKENTDNKIPVSFSRSLRASRPRQAAFTLVELLVVVAIISILAAMLMPALQKAVQTARSTACMNIHKQFALAFSMYLDDNGSIYPSESDSAATSGWVETIGKYVDDDSNRPALIIGKSHKGSGCPANATDFWTYAFNFNFRFQPAMKTDLNARFLVCSGNSNFCIFPHTGNASLQPNLSQAHMGGFNALHHGGHVKHYNWASVDATDPDWEKPWWVDGFPH